VVVFALHDEQLAKVACWHATQSHDPDEKDAGPESVEEENKVLVHFTLLSQLFPVFGYFSSNIFKDLLADLLCVHLPFTRRPRI
jgi:hypothetical protein